MTREEFRKYIRENIVILDGATGTNLMAAGMPVGVCPEEWVMEHPQVILDLQKAYVDNGTNIVYAPTFTGNRIKLLEYGLQEKINEINTHRFLTRELRKFLKICAQGLLLQTGKVLSMWRA